MCSEQAETLAEGFRMPDGAVSEKHHDPGVGLNFCVPLVEFPIEECGGGHSKPRGNLLLLQFKIQPPRPDVVAQGNEFLWITRRFRP